MQNLSKNYKNKIDRENTISKQQEEIDRINEINKKNEEEYQKQLTEYTKQLELNNQQKSLFDKYQNSILNRGEYHQLFEKTFEQKYGSKASDAEEFSYYNYKVNKGQNLSDDEIRNRAFAGMYLGKEIRNELGSSLPIQTYTSTKGIYTNKPNSPQILNIKLSQELSKPKYGLNPPSQSKIVAQHIANQQPIVTNSPILPKGFTPYKEKNLFDKYIDTYKANQAMAELAIKTQESKVKNAKTDLDKIKEKQTLGLAYLAGTTKYLGSPLEFIATEGFAPISHESGKIILDNSKFAWKPTLDTIRKTVPSDWKNNIGYSGARLVKDVSKGIASDPAILLPIAGQMYFINSTSANQGQTITQLYNDFQASPKKTLATLGINTIILHQINKAPRSIIEYGGQKLSIYQIPKEFRPEAIALRQAIKPLKGNLKPIKPIELNQVEKLTPAKSKIVMDLFRNNPNVSLGGSNVIYSSVKKAFRPPKDVEINYTTPFKEKILQKIGKNSYQEKLDKIKQELGDSSDFFKFEEHMQQRNRGKTNPFDNVLTKAEMSYKGEKIPIFIEKPGSVAWSKALDAYKSNKPGIYHRYYKDMFDAIKVANEFYLRELKNPSIKLPIYKQYLQWKYGRALDLIQKNFMATVEAEKPLPFGTPPIPNRTIKSAKWFDKKWFESDKLGEKGSLYGGKKEEVLTKYDREVLKSLYDTYSKNFRYPVTNIYSPNYGSPYSKEKYSKEKYYPEIPYTAGENYSPEKTNYPKETYIPETPPDRTETPPYYPDNPPYDPTIPYFPEKPPYEPQKLYYNPPKPKKESKLFPTSQLKRKLKKSGWVAELHVGNKSINDDYSYPTRELAVLRGLKQIDDTGFTHTRPVKGKGLWSTKKNYVQQKKFYNKNGTYYEKKKYWLDKPQEKNEYMKMLYRSNFQ